MDIILGVQHLVTSLSLPLPLPLLRLWLWLCLSTTMEGIQSWSTFEQQQRQSTANGSGRDTSRRGIDALYFSASSSDVAPSASKLLRQAGLLSSTTSSATDDGRNSEDEEFRFKYHWMRPHPSLCFSLEDEIRKAKVDRSETSSGMTNSTQPRHHNKQTHQQKSEVHPAVEASRLMKAYLNSQFTKGSTINTTTTSDENEDGTGDDDETRKVADTSLVNDGSVPLTDSNTTTANLPLELPKLRINLACLIEPPLMSSWLPGEETEITYGSE